MSLLTEVESVVNSRPLTVDYLSDALSLAPITPNHLLTMKSKIIMAPPGEFTQTDLYSRRRWRRVQHIINEFWSRWKHEYLQSLQVRSKWQKHRRNFRVDDIVIVKEDGPRNEWRLGQIIEVNTSTDGLVRSVRFVTSSGQYERPINKIVLLVKADESKEETVESPTRSHHV